ncbi:polysaccharide deacetylase family protein [Rhodopila globiformis]|uniref:glycosyltransferase n=1 Tax=Rhodopila globiformis TaxID=1071 RepID=UPI0011B0EA47|nr:glycosyltransferase [Rhodopila globiformis]
MAELANGVASPPVQALLAPPVSWPPTLVVVIDTEEEFDWTAPFDPASTAVSNIDLQPLAQAVFDAHGVVPTYVVDYPVASTPQAAAVLRAIAADGRCDIGAHLHPWVTPPAEGPVDTRHSYPGNLPAALERHKLTVLTDTIAASFGARPTVYKAGRYGIGAATPATLRALGYAVDVSVVPHTDFSADGGPDFRGAPEGPYRIADGLCELPLSVHFVGRLASQGPWLFHRLSAHPARRLRLPGVLSRLGLLTRLRLSPEGGSLTEMTRQTRAALAAGTRLFMLTYHSSSLLPGATQYVRTEADRRHFLATLDGYLHVFLAELGGRADTVTRVAAALMAGQAPGR